MEKMLGTKNSSEKGDFHKKLKKTKANTLSNLRPRERGDCIGQGWKISRDGEPFFWYGVEWEGGEPAIITNGHNFGVGLRGKTSKSDIFDIQSLGVFPDAPLLSEAIDRQWGLTKQNQGIDFPHAIQCYAGQAYPPITLKEVFEEIRDLNMHYMEHSTDAAHSLIALDIMATYWDCLFRHRGRTYFSALFDSGKSKQMDIYGELAHKPLKSINASPASVYRASHANYNTILIDDFDTVNEEQKTDLIQMMKAHSGANKVLRCVGREFNVQGFRIGPMVVNNTVGLDKTTISRFKLLRIPTSANKKIRNRSVIPYDPKWQLARDKLHVMGLDFFPDVFQAIRDFKCDDLSGRERDRVESVLILAKLVSNELFSDVLSFIQEGEKENRSEEKQSSEEYVVATYCIQSVLNNSNKEVVMEVREIVDAVEGSLIEGGESFRGSSKYHTVKYGLNRRISQMLRSSQYFEYKNHSGRAAYVFSRENLTKFCNARGFLDLLKPWEGSENPIENGESL